MSIYPSFVFGDSFSENDELWDPKIRETETNKDERMTKFLEYLFENNDNIFVALTSHSGVIATLLIVLGYREFKPQAGDVFPLLVKRQVVNG